MKGFMIFMLFIQHSWGIELDQTIGKRVMDNIKNGLRIKKGGEFIQPKVKVNFLRTVPNDTGRSNNLEFKLFDGDLEVGKLRVERARLMDNKAGKDKSIPGLELVLITNQSVESYSCVGSALMKIFHNTFITHKSRFKSEPGEAKMFIHSIESATGFYEKFGFVPYRVPQGFQSSFNLVHNGEFSGNYREQLKKCEMDL